MTAQEKIKGRRIGIVGMARSGMAVAKLAKRMEGIPFVSDASPESKLRESVQNLKQIGIVFETGGHTDQLLACEYLVLSPGVSLNIPILIRAREQGLPFFSEIEFASWVCKGRIVAITGSNGKTTTTTLVGKIIEAAGLETYVCGNIGLAFAEVADRISSNGIAVLEVSSYQLETISDFHPHIAAILNITPDHLDRHGTLDAYRRAKYRISENQASSDYLAMNHDDKESMTVVPDSQASVCWFSTGARNEQVSTWVNAGSLWVRYHGKNTEVMPTRDILIPGPHNLQNVAAAVLMGSFLNIEPAISARVLRTFPGVEHRIERCGSVAGINFINDSKATNVDSVVQALRSIDTPIHLIMGGRDKGGSYDPIGQSGKGKVKGIVAIGEAKEKIFASLGREFPVEFARSLEEAVERSFALASPGDTIMLSPACASFDMFDNFEHRGGVFKAAVASLKNGKKKNETVSG